MTILTFTLIVLVGGFAAGLIGSLSGMGGGVVIIPLLTIGLGVDIHYAIGTALLTVIAISSGSAAAYVKEGFTNMRLGMFLEIATTIGAVIGALVSAMAPGSFIAVLFGLTLIFAAINSIRQKEEVVLLKSSPLAEKLRLPGSYPGKNQQPIHYGTKNVLGGLGMMGIAGIMSGLLGIGSGVFKVIAMDNIMKIPFKVSTTTSNFMMGVTAIASTVIYLQKGYIQPGIGMPALIGVLFGSITGARILIRSNPQKLRLFFAVVILVLALNMIYNGVRGKI